MGPSSFAKVAKAILSDVQVILWRLAARHHLGQGLELSPPADVSFRWARQLASGASSIELGALECIMSGGLWLPHRVNSIRDWVPDVCPRCSQPFCDEVHLVWECPLLDLELESVVATQEFLPLVLQRDLDCLWLRGLLPRSLVAVGPQDSMVAL